MKPTIANIVAAVGAHFGVAKMDIMARRRDAKSTHARHVCCWLAKELTLLSYPQIGMSMQRDHTTVMNGVRVIEAKRMVDDVLQADLHELVRRLEHLGPSLGDLVVRIRYMSPEMLARALRTATLATGGFWNPPQPKYGDHLFVIDLLGVSASGFDQQEACHYWRKIALQTIDAQAA